MNPIAVMFVAIGQGLIEVNNPNTSADTNGTEEFEYRLLRNSSIHYNNLSILLLRISWNLPELVRAFINPSLVRFTI